MKTVWQVWKKELLNIARNRRRLFILVVFNFVLLPCLAVIPLGMITRKTVENTFQKLEVPVQGFDNAPDLIAYIEKNEAMTIIQVTDVEKLVREKQAAAGLIVPSDFEERVRNGESARITIVMDKSKSLSMEGARLKNILEKYNQTILVERLKKTTSHRNTSRPFKWMS